jgi:hypothetical protein
MVPNFGQQPRFIVTIQPPGVRFDPPAQVSHPNVDGLAPGEVTELYSFDHDMGSFVATGTATVSEDGSVLRSDAGTGILKGGWHCGGNPSVFGICLWCGECQQRSGVSCVPGNQSAPCGNDECKFCRDGKCVNRPTFDPPFPAESAEVGLVDPSTPLPEGCVSGRTQLEEVDFEIDVRCDGGQWRAVLTELFGTASVIARLQTGYEEAGTNVTAANYCAQVTSLRNLGEPCPAAHWYMRQAVVAHENVHVQDLEPALEFVSTFGIELLVESLTVPTAGTTRAQAIQKIKALPKYASAKVDAKIFWGIEMQARSPHSKAFEAERPVVAPMIQSLCQQASAQGWPPCAACSP